MMFDNAFVSILLCSSLASAVKPLVDLTFDSGSWKPWKAEPGGTDAAIAVVSPGYEHSEYAGAINVTSRTGDLIVYSPVYTHMQPGQLYEASADIKLLNPYCSTLFQNYEGILIALGDGLNNATIGSWATYKAPFFPQFTNESFNIAVFCDVPSNVKSPNGPVVEFDNILVTPVGKPYTSKSKPTGANLLQQPNFDSGTLDAYEPLTYNNASVSIVKPGYKGTKYAAEFSMTGVFAKPADVELLQAVPSSKASGVYKISFAWKSDMKLSKFCGGNSYIQQSGFPNGTQYIPYQEISLIPTDSTDPPPAGKWSYVEGWVAGLSNGFQAGIEAECLFDHGVLEFDDFQLVLYS